MITPTEKQPKLPPRACTKSTADRRGIQACPALRAQTNPRVSPRAVFHPKHFMNSLKLTMISQADQPQIAQSILSCPASSAAHALRRSSPCARHRKRGAIRKRPNNIPGQSPNRFLMAESGLMDAVCFLFLLQLQGSPAARNRPAPGSLCWQRNPPFAILPLQVQCLS
jgi:hypothetical protein